MGMQRVFWDWLEIHAENAQFCSLIVIKLLFMRVLTINFIDMLYPSLTLLNIYFYAFLSSSLTLVFLVYI